MRQYIIIGNGVAGDSAASKIRDLDRDATIDMFTKEDVPFYYRPRLIDYLSRETPIEKIILHSEKWYKEHNINLHLATEVIHISPEEKIIRTSDGRSFSYDRLLLATGAYNFVPPVTGIDMHKDRIFTLRDKSDADRILEISRSSKDAIIVGGGLLGLETANSLRKLGVSVKVVEFSPRLLPRQLDIDGAQILEKKLISMGFKFHLGESCEKISTQNNHLLLTLKSGKIIEGDFLIVSIGVRSQMKIAQEAGIKTNKGIIVDNHMKTNIEHIFAAGDVSEHGEIIYGIWLPGKEQGEIAGENMVNPGKPYIGTLSSHKLKIAGINMISTGEIDTDGKHESKVYKSEENFVYKKAVISNGRIIGSIMLGNIEGEQEVGRAIRKRNKFDEVKNYFEEKGSLDLRKDTE